MIASWLSLVPPFIVIITAFITKKLNQSLLLGLAVGALLAKGISLEAGSLLFNRLYNQISDQENGCNYLFLVVISTLIVLISRTGGALAFAKAITKHLKTKKMVETASLVVSSTLFIDDYLSNLTAGYAMRSLTDRFAIPRVKLAYLVHSLSSPLVVLSPVSSWIAQTTGFIESADISTVVTTHTKIIAEPFVMLAQTIPFIFFSIILIASVWFVVRMGISFGPMKEQELIAAKTGNLFGGKQAPVTTITIEEKAHASALDMILPVLLLITSIIIGFLFAGGYHLFGGQSMSVIQALKNNTKTAQVLLIASLLTIFISTIMALVRKTIDSKELPSIALEGFYSIYSAILMIYLATTLGIMMKEDLHVGVYLAGLVRETMPIWLLPCVLFLLATPISFMIGSTWGTIALLAPIGTQLLITLTAGTPPFAVQDIPMILPVLGSIFAGAICGNYISPISDTTIMASASCGTYPIDHIQTQLPYALPVIFASCISFIIAGLLISHGIWFTWVISLVSSIALCLLTMYILNRLYGSKK
ncbi:MAG TPA: Na+/H+ antiporter NhaC family protein [Candidatus Babeliales bacterium]|nr:Na+/H+ antiporter NhaC family protein [Candidatus Babeliales bacterium]